MFLENLSENKYKAFFFINDTGGKYHEAVEYIYQLAYGYKSSGIETYILHEKDEYTIPSGIDYQNKYSQIEHLSFSKMASMQMKISHEDFIFIPDVYLEFISQLKEQMIPAEFIIIIQNINVIFDMLEMGQNIYQLGVRQVIVPDQAVKEYMEEYFTFQTNPKMSTTFHVLSPFVEDIYKSGGTISKPQILLTDGRSISYERFVKKFYLKFPHYGWIPFKVMDDSDIVQSRNDIMESAFVVSFNEGILCGQRMMQAVSCGKKVITKKFEVRPVWTYGLESDIVEVSSPLESAVAHTFDYYLSGGELDKEGDKVFSYLYFMENFKSVAENIKNNRIEFLNAVNEKQKK